MGDNPPLPTKIMIPSIIRTAVRNTLIADGPQTCSQIVRRMGLDPKRHKGTIHAIMVDMERAGQLGSTKHKSGKRDLWFAMRSNMRKRDRLSAFIYKVTV